MKIKPEHLLFTDEQMADIAAVVVADDDPDAPAIVWNNETGRLVAVVRSSYSETDMRSLFEYFEMVRIDWLSVLGYGSLNHQQH